MKPEDSRIHIPQIPNNFVPRFLIFFLFFKGQETQRRVGAEAPGRGAALGAGSQSPRSDSYIKPRRPRPARRSDSSSLF